MSDVIKFIQSGELMKFYKSKEWRALREIAMRRDNYECQHCRKKGLVTTKETLKRMGKRAKMDVNHKLPVKTHPHLALELANLEYLCIDCHNIADGKDKMIRQHQPKFMNEERW